MHEWLDKNFAYIFPVYLVTMWIIVGYVIALAGGWRLLAQRFRIQGDFLGQKWTMQSARMRTLANYNNVLTVGADNAGLFIVPFFLFRAWHAPLYIPWVEITVRNKTRLYFFRFVELRLGRSEQIPFTINARLAARIEAAAGPGWPGESAGAADSPPPPIG
jgi:hypothetical protein